MVFKVVLKNLGDVFIDARKSRVGRATLSVLEQLVVELDWVHWFVT